MRSALHRMPLKVLYGGIGGILAVLSVVASRTFPAGIVSVVAVLVFVLFGAIVGRMEDSLRQRASTDPLTQVANRRQFDATLSRALVTARTTRMPLTVLFVDVDHLKEINDELGHAAGDATLKLVGETLARTCRSRDLPARWGGDEFVILAPWTSAAEALVLANRIRAMLPRIAEERGFATPPTVSVGVAELDRVDSSPDGLLCAADDALYLAKLRGRNRVEIAPRDRARKHVPEMRKMRTRPLRIGPEDLPRLRPDVGRGERI